MSAPFAVAVGANLGDAVAVMAAGVRELAGSDGVRLTAVSGLYRTAPVGMLDQPDFFNAVVVGSTTLDAAALLALCHRIEAGHGRTRELRWGPRTLDLDLLVVGDAVRDEPGLTLPHPRAHERAFVLVPWLDADPHAALPGRGAVADLLSDSLADSLSDLTDGAASDGVRPEPDARWAALQDEVRHG